MSPERVPLGDALMPGALARVARPTYKAWAEPQEARI